MTHRTKHHRLALFAAAAATLALTLAGCASDTPAASSSTAASAGSAISADRCAKNKAAGTVTFITGYQYQASVSILDVIAAKSLGYFDAVCLDIEIQPGTGDTASNAQLVSAGTAQLSALSGEGDLIVNASNGQTVTGIATFGHVPIATLMTPTTVTDLKQLDGTTLGQKGALPVDIKAMLVNAGVDLDSITQVTVGYDPSVLTRGQVQSLTGYKSNEPLTLKAQGASIKEWNPEDFGVPGSISTIIANPAFAAANPTVVEDFLRAELYAYSYCEKNASECVNYASALSTAGYDVDHNVQVWQTETGLVDSSLPKGTDLGTIDTDSVTKEAQFLLTNTQITAVPDIAKLIDDSYLASVYKDGALVWPAP